MRIHYQTGTATFIQLAVVVFLIVMNNVVAFIDTCFGNSANCVAGAFVSMVIIMFAALWYGFLSVLGYAAQEKRNRKLALTLMAAQLFTAFIALVFARLPGNWFALLTSLVACGIAIWVSVLAYRLSKARGGRIVQRHTRKRFVKPE